MNYRYTAFQKKSSEKMGLIDAGVGAGLGLLLGPINDRRQARQNQRLMDQQIAGSKEMADYNKQIALDMWEKTNYEAQRKQMEKAGLNVGLMYGGSGGGGTTQSNSGNVSTSQANPTSTTMGLELGLQAMMQQAQIENIKANTEKTKVDTEKTAGADTNLIQSQIEQIGQGIKNSEIQNKLTQAQTEQQNITNQYTGDQAEKGIQLLKDQHEIITQQLRSAKAQGDFDENTLKNRIKQQAILTTQGQLNLALTEAGIQKTEVETQEAQAKIQKIAEEIINMQELREQGQTKLANEKEQLLYNRIDTEFRSGRGAKSVRGLQTIFGGINAITGALK